MPPGWSNHKTTTFIRAGATLKRPVETSIWSRVNQRSLWWWQLGASRNNDPIQTDVIPYTAQWTSCQKGCLSLSHTDLEDTLFENLHWNQNSTRMWEYRGQIWAWSHSIGILYHKRREFLRRTVLCCVVPTRYATCALAKMFQSC